MHARTFFNSLITVDRICDYIPFVGTLSNTVDIIIRKICKDTILSQATHHAYSEYLTYLKNKDPIRITFSMVPGLLPIIRLVQAILLCSGHLKNNQ